MNRRPVPEIAALGNRSSRSKARGASLLEAIAFLSIAAIVAAGATALFGVSFRSANGARLIDETNAIAANVRELYSLPSTGGYGALSMIDLYHHGAFPSTLQAAVAGGNVTLTNAWSGAVTLTLNAASLPVLTYGNVPKAVCMAALLSSGNWTSVTVNNVAQPTSGITAAQAAVACAGNANTIAWGFS
ncbi:MAG: type 4 pilus major pilin [Trinickia sp.]